MQRMGPQSVAYRRVLMRRKAAALCGEHKLATADAVIYATSREYGGVEVVTCDAHFQQLPGVTYIPKIGA